ncbi:MAG: hypothetical protein HY978_02625 [Candidatus Liptonbacteria bacterium]|nr:hypothetical protein [Candidatus Liptonbacteria bacterium]
MPNFIHKDLAAGRWFGLSILEQLGNIGSEVSRAAKWQSRNPEIFAGAVDRSLDLFDLTLADPRWFQTGRRYEIARAREVFCDAALNQGAEYGSQLKDLQSYFDQFALAARNKADLS